MPKLGSKQPQLAGRTRYVTWRNPFLYFRSLTGGTACHQSEVGIGQLAKDVKSPSTAPSLAYIIPPPCAAGGEAPCKTGAPTSLAATNRFLRSVVPEIKRSAAYKDDSMIAITFDQAPQSATTPATTPATSLGAGETTPSGGGGQVGLLLISHSVKPGSIDVVDYFNHFSLLASIENLFGLHRLGYARIPGLPVFGLGVYNAYAG